MKNPVTPAGIEPATFRFVAQHLNHPHEHEESHLERVQESCQAV